MLGSIGAGDRDVSKGRGIALPGGLDLNPASSAKSCSAQAVSLVGRALEGMVARFAGARGAQVASSGGSASKLESLLLEAATEFSMMPEAQVGLTAFCHNTYDAKTTKLLTQLGFISPAKERTCAAEEAASGASSGPAPVRKAVGGMIVAVKTEACAGAAPTSEAAVTSTATSEEPPGICQCRTSTCFDFLCVARASKARYYLKTAGIVDDETCRRPVVAGSAFCTLCKCTACPKHNSSRTRFCFSKGCVTHGMPRPGHPQRVVEAEAAVRSTAAYCNLFGRHSLPEAWPPSLKVSAKLGWLLVQNTPLDYMVWLEFAEALSARRVNGIISCTDVLWLFTAHFIKWPAAVSRFHDYAMQAFDVQAGTAAAIVDALARVLVDLSGHAFLQMHARMSSKGRMHSATGVTVHAQWLGLLRKLDVGTQAAAGDVVVRLGVSQSAYVLNPCRDDAVRLVAAWLAVIRKDWPEQVDVASFAASADAIVNTAARLRTMSEGSAGPLNWTSTGEVERGMQSSGEPPKHKKRCAPGYLAKHFAKCMLFRYETALEIEWTEPPLGSLSMAAVLQWTPDERGFCDVIADMPLREAVRVFGYSPLLISGFACFASAVDEVQMACLFQAADRDLFGVVAKWRKELEAASPDDETVSFSPMCSVP